MLKGYKYRIYPNDQQKQLIEQTFGCCRLVYNLALEVKMTAYKNAGINLSAYDLQKQLTQMKKDYDWLRNTDSQALNDTILNIDKSFKRFFNGAGFPKFKKKSDRQSYGCPHSTRRVDFEKGLLIIPKIKNIKISISRKFEGKIKTVTISRTPTGKYFASILVDNGKGLPTKPIADADKTIGVDLGIKDFAILSDGTKFENPKHLRNNLKRLKCLQRRASRKKKGSNNRKKENKKVAIQHERITNMRKDFLHKFSTKLVCDSQATTFCFENLNVTGMVKNHSLAQAISDVGWSTALQFVKYKCDWYGKNYVEIGRFEPSSKTCSCCGAINETLTLKDRTWTCANCLTLHYRDKNAAKNIEIMGFKKHSGVGNPGEPVEPLPIGRVKKQEVIDNHQSSMILPTKRGGESSASQPTDTPLFPQYTNVLKT